MATLSDKSLHIVDKMPLNELFKKNGSRANLIMDDMLYVGDVEAAGSHVRRDEEAVLRGREPVQVLQTLLLVQLNIGQLR